MLVMFHLTSTLNFKAMTGHPLLYLKSTNVIQFLLLVYSNLYCEAKTHYTKEITELLNLATSTNRITWRSKVKPTFTIQGCLGSRKRRSSRGTKSALQLSLLVIIGSRGTRVAVGNGGFVCPSGTFSYGICRY